MRLEPRRIVIGLVIAGIVGGALFLPVVYSIGTMLAPSQPVPATGRVPPVLADALWARANGGRATALQPLNPFTIGRTMACHILAERFDDSADRDRQHDECMKLLPAVQAVGYLSSVHMRSEGVWQDPRVPFVQIATMTRITGAWTKAELLSTLAARAEFGFGFVGAEAASIGYFGRSTDQLTLPQAALLAAFIGDRGTDPWCDPAAAARIRHRVLESMRDNLVIDATAVDAANVSEITLAPPPVNHKSCGG